MGIIRLPDIRARLQTVELQPVGSTSAEFARTIAKDLETWEAVAKAANVKVE
jgi:tripartite-type tricarboxylate transporter receptor subunit TctC